MWIRFAVTFVCVSGLQTNPTFWNINQRCSLRCCCLEVWVTRRWQMILWLCGGGEEGEKADRWGEREIEGGDGGGAWGAEGERWSARSGSVSASVSATAGSSSSACHVGSKALCGSELLHDDYYFVFVCESLEHITGCGVHSYKCVTVKDAISWYCNFIVEAKVSLFPPVM